MVWHESWTRGTTMRRRVALACMAVATLVVSLAARGDLAVSLQLAAFGPLLWQASLGTFHHKEPM